jgi:hypothetical protein
MENLKTKKICVIGDSQWCQKLMDITYEMGVLGGVVESNLKRYMFLLKSYPGIFLHTHIERTVEGYDSYIVDICNKNEFEIVRFLLNNKKNVLMKKVSAIDISNIFELINISKSTGSRIMFGNTLEFYNIISTVIEIISRGQIGEIEEVLCFSFNNPIPNIYGNDLLFSIREETVLINQLNRLIDKPVEKIYFHKDFNITNNSEENTYLSIEYSPNIHQHFFVSFKTVFSNFKMFLIGKRCLVIIEGINGNYKLTLHGHKRNCLKYKLWSLSKKAKNINHLLEEELQFFIGHEVSYDLLDPDSSNIRV